LKSGMRVLDAGCGPGKTTSILSSMIMPGGHILGVDYSEKRIQYAKRKYRKKTSVDFRIQDLREPLEGSEKFDLVWVRFVLEYNRTESVQIVKNLTERLKPGGYLCLLDLDQNCLNHYGLPDMMDGMLSKLMSFVEKNLNFDPYSGRKLYAYLYDEGYENIQVDLRPHHLFYGKMRSADIFNWLKKAEVASARIAELFEEYPGGFEAFYRGFETFLEDPRRFTYTPLIICRGRKPI
ncbi:MAG: class I SAM-dependent methyltransferase, partial [Pseudomonadota bacterium]